MDTPPPPLSHEDRKNAAVALLTVAVLAFVLTEGAERALGLKKNPRRRALRRNGRTTRVHVTHDANGLFTGHVLDRESGRTLAVTFAEPDAFAAKRSADKMARGIERQRETDRRRRARAPHRVTSTGVLLQLVPKNKSKRPR